jgi:hypothetical protein
VHSVYIFGSSWERLLGHVTQQTNRLTQPIRYICLYM